MTAEENIGNGCVPIQLAQCRFPGLAISNAKILVYCSNKKYGNNFIKQQSETVMVSNYQNAGCSLREKKLLCHFFYNFRQNFVLHCGPSTEVSETQIHRKCALLRRQYWTLIIAI